MLNEASKQRVKILCDKIAKEEDRDRFSKLISELNELLESADSRNGDGRFHVGSNGKIAGNPDGGSDGKANDLSAGKIDGMSAGKTDGNKDIIPPGKRPS